MNGKPVKSGALPESSIESDHVSGSILPLVSRQDPARSCDAHNGIGFDVPAAHLDGGRIDPAEALRKLLDGIAKEWIGGWRQCGCMDVGCRGRHAERDELLDDMIGALIPRIAAALEAESASLRERVAGWQPIETAPKGVERHGKKAMSWMMLAWPDGAGGHHTANGMRVGDQFFAAATFHTGGPFDGKQFTLKEIEVFPTHWMHLLAPPAALSKEGA